MSRVSRSVPWVNKNKDPRKMERPVWLEFYRGVRYRFFCREDSTHVTGAAIGFPAKDTSNA